MNKSLIFFATHVRSLKKTLLDNKNLNFQFAYIEKKIQYGATSLKNRILSKLIHNRLFDVFGVIQVIKPPKGYRFYGSENRFLSVDKPYFIHVENPTALYHYCLNRNNTFLGKRKISKYLNNLNLRALIFWSKKCEETFETVCCKIPQHIYTQTIYNLVLANPFVTKKTILARHSEHNKQPLRLLYCVQGIRFFSKGGLEVIESYKKMQHDTIQYLPLLTIITNLNIIGEKLCNEILLLGIELLDFKLSKEQMQKKYAETDILIQPTSDDSFGMTILEAMKGGCAILGSNLYAVPEMVKEGENGYLCDPAYWFFNPDGTPNPQVWNHKKRTIYSGKTCDRIVDFLVEKITLLNENRELLKSMCIKSLEFASTPPFSEEYIIEQWNNVYKKLKK